MTQSIQHYEERFQERVDELLFLENKVEEHIKRLADMNEHSRKVYEGPTLPNVRRAATCLFRTQSIC